MVGLDGSERAAVDGSAVFKGAFVQPPPYAEVDRTSNGRRVDEESTSRSGTGPDSNGTPTDAAANSNNNNNE